MTGAYRTVVEKLLSANDVGVTNSHQAGILVPKEGRILRLFPDLDHDRKNPDREVSFYVPQLDVYWTGRLVFYNTKDLGIGTRSEYRLTRIVPLLREVGASPGDSLQFCVPFGGPLEVKLRPRDIEPPSQVTPLRGGWTLMIDDD
jgi:hypothetical protein